MHRRGRGRQHQAPPRTGVGLVSDACDVCGHDPCAAWCPEGNPATYARELYRQDDPLPRLEFDVMRGRRWAGTLAMEDEIG